jgi:hypothetical protein
MSPKHPESTILHQVALSGVAGKEHPRRSTLAQIRMEGLSTSKCEALTSSDPLHLEGLSINYSDVPFMIDAHQTETKPSAVNAENR